MISGRLPPTLHHIHGGSCGEIGLHSGMAQRGISDWLVIPLAAEFHTSGKYAIDGGYGVLSWEDRFGTQVKMMDEVCCMLSINAWQMAGIARIPWNIHE